MESEVIKLNELSTDQLVDIMSTNLRGYEYDVIIELCRRADRLNALEADRERYVAALERIELMDPDWTLGVDENMERLRTIATQALGGGDEAV